MFTTLCTVVRPSYAVGVINYQNYDELKACLDSVQAQTHAPDLVVVVDIEGNEARQQAIRQRPGLHIEDAPNRGFAASANLALRTLRERSNSSFFLLLNPDVGLDPSYAARLVEEMQARPRVALASGKLLRPDGSIDSAGIVLPRHRRPRDRGSEEEDLGQYDETELVFGASGAAMMIRGSSLSSLAIEGEIFDEAFFMYHEDTDLCWRAQVLGWQVLYAPAARARHTRNWRRDRRFEIAPYIRRHSFKNHYLQLIKNERGRDLWWNLPILASWEIMRLGYAALWDREILPGYRDAWRLAGRAWHKRRLVQSARALGPVKLSEAREGHCSSTDSSRPGGSGSAAA